MTYLMLGRRTQGKTTLAYFVASRVVRRMVFDPRGLIRSEASNVVTNTRGIQQAAEALTDEQIVELVVTPEANVDRSFQVFCDEAARVLRDTPDVPLAILIDEVRFMDIRNESLDWILRTSPVDSTHIIFTGHRPKDIPPDIRAIADKWDLFQFTLKRDLDLIAEQCSEAVARDVQRLQPRQFIEWDDQIGKARYFSDPTRWYIPLTTAHQAKRQTQEAALGGLGG